MEKIDEEIGCQTLRNQEDKDYEAAIGEGDAVVVVEEGDAVADIEEGDAVTITNKRR